MVQFGSRAEPEEDDIPSLRLKSGCIRDDATSVDFVNDGFR